MESAVSIIDSINDSFDNKQNGSISIYASRYDSTNDPGEVEFARKKVYDSFKVTLINREFSIVPFIISFCTLNDDPIMWRLYKSSIQFVFDKTKLNTIGLLGQEMQYFANDSALKQDVIQWNIIKKASDYYNRDFPIDALDDQILFSCLYPFIKHESYSCEHEWRIVCRRIEMNGSYYISDGVNLTQDTNIHYRYRYGQIFPYTIIHLPLSAFVGIVINEPNDIRFQDKRNKLTSLFKTKGLLESNFFIKQTKTAEIR